MSGGGVALVVLGCVIRAPVEGDNGDATVQLGAGAAARRVNAAARAWLEGGALPGGGEPEVIIASGGRVWNGRTEADAMACALVARGVPEAKITCERLSFSTRENARYVAGMCRARGLRQVALVTCVWHLPRAAKCFEAEGLRVVARISAGEGAGGWMKRTWTRARERALSTLVETR